MKLVSPVYHSMWRQIGEVHAICESCDWTSKAKSMGKRPLL